MGPALTNDSTESLGKGKHRGGMDRPSTITVTQRRRAGNGNVSPPQGSVTEDGERRSGTPRASSPARDSASKSLLEDQNRSDYVYDDRGETDLGSTVGGSPNTRLTLMDEVVLLGLNDQQGYPSFLNDSISYVLRGCIIMELALRRRIRVTREAGRKRAFPDRLLEVINPSTTDEVLLDEALKLVKGERQSIATWMDLMSGETWNPMKVTYQLKQVRERIAKGLVDKGILRTEKRSFMLFDMAIHPLSNPSAKEELVKRTRNTCLGRGPVPSLRSIALVCAASTANVLENALDTLPSGEKEAAFQRVEEFMKDYSSPAEKATPLPAANEIIAGVLTVFGRLDSLLY